MNGRKPHPCPECGHPTITTANDTAPVSRVDEVVVPRCVADEGVPICPSRAYCASRKQPMCGGAVLVPRSTLRGYGMSAGDAKAGIVVDGRCRQCGAVALKPNRRGRRRGLDYIMVHASWCPVQGIGWWAGRHPAPRGGGRS